MTLGAFIMILRCQPPNEDRTRRGNGLIFGLAPTFADKNPVKLGGIHSGYVEAPLRNTSASTRVVQTQFARSDATSILYAQTIHEKGLFSIGKGQRTSWTEKGIVLLYWDIQSGQHGQLG